MGLRLDNFSQATRRFGVVTALGCALLLLLGLAFGQYEPVSWVHFGTYLCWAFVQQHLLQNFLRQRAQEVLGAVPGEDQQSNRRVTAALVAATLFAAFHLPNWPLAALSLGGGFLWCLLFFRTPSLPWAAFSQALLVTVLLLFFKSTPLDQFNVGAPGFRYEYFGTGVKVAGAYGPEGQPYVVTLPGQDIRVHAKVRLFTLQGELAAEWTAFGEYGFSGEIAAGNLDLVEGDEIVVAPGPGPENPSILRIFDTQGRLLKEVGDIPFDYGYGAWVSVACNRIYVTPGPAPGAPQRVVELDSNGILLNQWEFTDLRLVNSIRATAVCSDLPAEQGKLLLWATDISINPSTVFLVNRATGEITSFETLTTTFGAQLAVAKLKSGQQVIAVAPGPLSGYPPLIGVFDLHGKQILRFSPYEAPENAGANVGAVDIDGDGQDELILGEGVGKGRPFTVRVYNLEKELVASWEAY